VSILAYVGLPGSGKSYNVVAHQVIPALQDGRTVVTNIPLNMPAVLEMFPDADVRDFPVQLIAEQPELIEEKAPPGCVLIIDELWRLFPAGQTVRHVPEQFKSLLAEHRHRVDAKGRSMQIVFVTQDLAQIGAFARQLVEQTFLHTKLGALGMSGSFRVRIFHGVVTGSNPGKGSEIRMVLGKYRPEIYRLYKSHTMSQSGESGADEAAMDKRANIWRRPGIWVAAVICLIGGVWAVVALKGVFSSDSVLVSESLKTAGVERPQSPIGETERRSVSRPAVHLPGRVPLSCVKLIMEPSGRVQCSCRNESGQEELSGRECINHMQSTIGGYGGPDAKAANIAMLDAVRSGSTAF